MTKNVIPFKNNPPGLFYFAAFEGFPLIGCVSHVAPLAECTWTPHPLHLAEEPNQQRINQGWEGHHQHVDAVHRSAGYPEPQLGRFSRKLQ